MNRPIPHDRSARFALALAAGSALAVFSVVASGAPAKADAAKVARGKYLVTVAGCNDCHTPWKMGTEGPEPDMARMLSGHPEDAHLPPPPAMPAGPWVVTVAGTNTAWSGPWGVSYTANLTPDPQTGLGQWSVRNFVDTMRSGHHLGHGRAILPPMPIRWYRNFTDGDLQAIYAYLRTIPAVHNRVPEPLPPAIAPTASHK